MHEVLVTIATYAAAADAYIAKGILESAGITCFIFDENMSFVYSNAVGGIKLKIPSSQRFLAKEILKQTGESIPEEDYKKVYECPQCGSSEVEFKKSSIIISLLASLLSVLHIPPVKNKLKCKMCGFNWEADHTEKIIK